MNRLLFSIFLYVHLRRCSHLNPSGSTDVISSPPTPALPLLTSLSSPPSPHLPLLTSLSSPPSPHLPLLTSLSSPLPLPPSGEAVIARDLRRSREQGPAADSGHAGPVHRHRGDQEGNGHEEEAQESLGVWLHASTRIPFLSDNNRDDNPHKWLCKRLCNAVVLYTLKGTSECMLSPVIKRVLCWLEGSGWVIVV